MYHDYYNIIHNDYDYDLDVSIIIDLSNRYKLNRNRLIEVGCGTGKHTALFSKNFQKTLAIDKDLDMIKRAKKHLSSQQLHNVDFFHGSVLDLEYLPGFNTDISCAFFNVINYILDFESLVKSFKNLALITSVGGIFVFDLLDWTQKYDPKASFKFSHHLGDTKYTRTVDSIYNQNTQIMQVYETYFGLFEKEISEHVQTYKIWSQKEIEKAASLTDFTPLFYSNKLELNPNYKKKNQVLFQIQKEGN